MATKKRNVKRTTIVRSAARPKRRRTAVSSRRIRKTRSVFDFLVPFVFILAILGCLGFLLFKGYQTVTASSFFDVRKVEVRGNIRVSREEVEKIVRIQTERDGVWNAELEQIKGEVEKLDFVRSAVVLRMLPDGILVRLEERIPKAVVRLNNTDVWVDEDAVVVGAVGKETPHPSFQLRGWDEAKTEKAQKDNQERVRLFLKIQDEWQSLGIEKKIVALNLSDLQDVQAIVQDSGETVSVFLGREDYARRLQSALAVIEGQGQKISYVKSYGRPVQVGYRNS